MVRHVDLRPPRPGHRLLRLGAAGARRGPGRGLRLPHGRRRRRPAWLGAHPRASSSAARCGAPSSAAACSGSRPPARSSGSGRRDHGRRVRAAADGRCRSTRAAARRCAGSSRGMGVDVRLGTAPRVDRGRRRRPGGRAASRRRRGADAVPVDVVVFATGVRPRDELAAPAGLAIGARGGVVVDEACRTDDARRLGDRRGRLHRRPLPGPRRARLRDGGDRRRPAARRRGDLPGRRPVDQAQAARGRRRVASVTPSRRRRVPSRSSTPTRSPGSTRSSCVTDDARTLLGGVLVGDASAYASLRPMVGAELGGDPAPVAAARGRRRGTTPDRAARRRRGLLLQQRDRRRHPRRRDRARLPDVAAVKACTRAGTSLRVLPPAGEEADGRRAGQGGSHAVSTALCEHFGPVAGRSCSTSCGSASCAPSARSSPGSAPAGAATSASRWSPRSSPRSTTSTCSTADRAALQDTNDRVMANLQKDGTYSVVPRVPGGEITPEQLVAHRPGGAGLRPLHEDHRRPADRPVRCPARAAAGHLGAAGGRRDSSPATPTARRCAR